MKTLMLITQSAIVLGASLFSVMTFANTDKAQALVAQAAYKIKTGNPGKAEMLYAQALQEDPTNRDIPLSLAELYIQQHRYDDAEQSLIKGDTQYYRFWKVKGILHQVRNEKSQAIAAFEKAIQLTGGKSDAYILTCLQTHYESIGNSAAKKQMENLIDMAKVNKSSP